MNVAGIVLAGGRSSRMGRPKADLDWHGRPLLVHVATALLERIDGPVIVVGAPGQPLPPLPPEIEITRDAAEGRGPLQGLVAGLRAVPGHADVAAVIATDQPYAADLVGRLTQALRDTDDAVAFTGQPLGALYRPRIRPVAERRLDGGDASLRGLLAAVDARTLELDDTARRALRSLDTPEDYAAELRP